MAQVMKTEKSEYKKSKLTLKTMQEMLGVMAEAHARQPAMTISGGYLMSLDDYNFAYLYKRKDVLCLSTAAMQPKIEARAKKLGLTNEAPH